METVLPDRKGLEALLKKKKIRVYLGVDPTSPDLHLGHTIALRKLKEFEDLGHETILLFGTFTAQIGDPSGRDEQRKPLSPAEVSQNTERYQEQTAKILDFSKTKIRRNNEWLSKLTLTEVLKLASHFTISQLVERDMFQARMKKGGEVWVHEFLYPLMQGYDSVALDVDLEIGATDQLFNMLVGRKLQNIYHDREKYVLTVPLLPGLDGRKMSKTYGNAVNLLDPPQEMYGKLMTLRDNLIPTYFELCTSSAPPNLPPRDRKAALAKEIVALYHGRKAAASAEKEFVRVFQKKQAPSTVPSYSLTKKTALVDLLVAAKLASSKSEARRLVSQKGVKINSAVQTDGTKIISPGTEAMVQVGKRRFLQLI